MSLTQAINNLKAQPVQASPGPMTPPTSAHQVFVEAVFQENGPWQGIFNQMFRVFTKTFVTYEDFVIDFHFSRGEWHIRVKPKTNVGKFAIKQLKEATIKSELVGGDV